MKGAREPDVIIVGAGSAGCVLAARLSEDPGRSVLLLEAGPDYPTEADLPADIRSGLNPTIGHDWGFANAAPPIPLPRGKLVGGCSATNGAFALRGHPEDYDEWAALGNAGWSFDEVLPFFRRLESDADFDGPAHGRDGPLPIRRYTSDELMPEQRAFLQAGEAAGFARVPDHNAPGAVGIGPLPVNTVDGVRRSTAVTYLAQARPRSNLSIRANAHVDRIIFDGTTARGVRLAPSGEVVRAARVVLSAGAYASPAILLRSGIGAAADLRSLGVDVVADLPGVGANLIDHPRFRLAYATPPYPAEVRGCQTVLTFRSDPKGAVDLQIFPWSTVPSATSPTGGAFAINVGVMKPRSKGSVKLKSTDPLAAPIIDSAFLRDPHDMARMIHGVRTARRLARSPALAEFCRTELDPGPSVGDGDRELETAIRAGLKTYYHPVGTCRMGADALAVVDARAKVYGVEGLFVVDASIMPTIPSANTNLPTIMAAERCAEWLCR